MSADRAGDQYPSVPVCDECAKTESQGEEPAIVTVGAFDDAYGDECHFCGKTKEDEDEEKEQGGN